MHGIFPDQVLTFVDRLSMAHSLEVRSAFLDTDVVEFVAALPGSMKIRRRRHEVPAQAGGAALLPRGDGAPAEGRVPDADHRSGCEATCGRGSARRCIRRGWRGTGSFRPLPCRRCVDRSIDPGCDYRTVNKVLVLVMFQEWHDMYLE